MVGQNITVRLFHEDEWNALKAIRLEGLGIYPNMMGQPLAAAEAMTPEQWRKWINDPYRGYFGIYDEKTIIGFYFVCMDTENKNEAYLNGVYLKREYQRQGIDQLLLEKALDWAKEKKCTSIQAGCKETNYAVKRLLEKHGGRFIRKSDQEDDYPDGSKGYGLLYKLDIT